MSRQLPSSVLSAGQGQRLGTQCRGPLSCPAESWAVSLGPSSGSGRMGKGSNGWAEKRTQEREKSTHRGTGMRCHDFHSDSSSRDLTFP